MAPIVLCKRILTVRNQFLTLFNSRVNISRNLRERGGATRNLRKEAEP